jgi:hypothetical protein
VSSKVVAFGIGLLMLVAGCSGPHHGYVMGKTVVPPMDYIWLMPITIGKTTTLVPMPQHIDACPQLTLADDPQNHPSKTNQICVTWTTYQKTSVGTFYTDEGT